MYCVNCGAQLGENDRFCPNCGAAVPQHARQVDTAQPAQAAQPMWNAQPAQDPSLPEGIFRDETGAYHWFYDQDLKKHPVILWIIIKLMFFICLGLGTLMFFVIGFGGDWGDAFRTFLIITFAIGGFLIAIGFLAWLIVLAINGSVYHFEFIMGEDRVATLQTGGTAKNSKKLATATMVGAALTGNLTMMGSSMAAAASQRTDSEYSKVKKLIAAPKHDEIKVNHALLHNMVYAYPHQYKFVWDFLVEHCPGATIQG